MRNRVTEAGGKRCTSDAPLAVIAVSFGSTVRGLAKLLWA